jgi:hypothetical protein
MYILVLITIRIWEPAAAVWPFGTAKILICLFITLKIHSSGPSLKLSCRYQGQYGYRLYSDTEPQPLTVRSHLGPYVISTIGKINNLHEIANQFVAQKKIHLLGTSQGTINPTELVAVIIDQENSFKRVCSRHRT